MVKIIKARDKQKQSLARAEEKPKKHHKLIETTYRSNNNSDYTEKIEELEKNFKYISNSNHYWSEPEHSMLYGTPIYETASFAQQSFHRFVTDIVKRMNVRALLRGF